MKRAQDDGKGRFSSASGHFDLLVDILDAISTGVLGVTKTGEVAFVNRHLEKTLGYAREAIKGLRVRDLSMAVADIDGTVKIDLEVLLENVLENAVPIRDVHCAIAKADGKRVFVTADVVPIVGADKTVEGAVLTIESLALTRQTDRDTAKLEAAVRRAQKVESIGRLAGGVAHNLNNILSPIIGYTDMAMETLKPQTQLYGYLEEIRTATNRATGLVNQLLAYGRKQAFELRPINLSRVVADLEAILRQTIREDIALNLDLDLALQQVRADLSQVHRIIVDLTLNGCEAMPNGGSLTLQTRNAIVSEENKAAHPDVTLGNYVVLVVADTGRGMDEDTLSRVFDPFFTTKEVGKGSGLGLSTVYGIVKQHGGYIRVESKPGKGSVFKVYLPQLDSREPLPAPPRRSTPKKPADETILVVEDEASLLKFTCLVLKKQGYTVLEASNGIEAREVAARAEQPIHLLLTDVIMPGKNGKEIYKELSKLHPEMKILYTSGYPDDVIARHGIIDQGENLLQKPTTVDQLTQKVRSVLDG
ncbi:MAG: ATP-binding protein [Myxococcota bacterium]|nr:ATP-binding protein [Myxococcota bacterium]